MADVDVCPRPRHSDKRRSARPAADSRYGRKHGLLREHQLHALDVAITSFRERDARGFHIAVARTHGFAKRGWQGSLQVSNGVIMPTGQPGDVITPDPRQK